MVSSKWWHVAVVGTAIGLSLLVAVQQPAAWRTVGVAVVNFALVVGWLFFGRFYVADEGRDKRGAMPFVVLVVLAAGVGTAFHPTMATVQCLAFPIIWCLLPRLRDAVFGSIAIATCVGVGMFIGTGASAGAAIQAVLIEGVSLVFALALGIWITSIADRSDERQRLIDELEAAQAQLALLSRDAGAAGERERLALEIHDTIAQDLAGLVMTAERSRRELRNRNLDAVDAQLAVLEENARNALAETRALVASGAAVGVDGSGLATALGRLGERFQRETGIAVTVTADDTLALDRDGEVVLLRCAQEALANVRKHSAAMAATVALAAHGDEVVLRVSDDGSGFDDSAGSIGFGLEGMRGRLALVNGTLRVTTALGTGTVLIASLPRERAVNA